jgi:hypothetical protein
MATVFVSYRSEDEDLAKRLAEDFQSAGHSVWFAIWSINVGDSIVEEMNKGLTDSGFLVFCYTNQELTSPWMSREWMSTLARQLQGARVRVLPARLTGGIPPAILADIRYADLAKDWATGLRQLLEAINR